MTRLSRRLPSLSTKVNSFAVSGAIDDELLALLRDLLALLLDPLLQLRHRRRGLAPERVLVERQFAEARDDEVAIEEREQVAGLRAGFLVEQHAVDRLERERLLDRREPRDLEDLRLQRVVLPRRLGQRVGEPVQKGALRRAEFLRARRQRFLQPRLLLLARVIARPTSARTRCAARDGAARSSVSGAPLRFSISFTASRCGICTSAATSWKFAL